MNHTIDEAAIAAEEQHRMDVWRIQQCAKRKRGIFDDYHPDAIRERIKSLQALLTEAGV
jgi:hypothetical protein